MFTRHYNKAAFLLLYISLLVLFFAGGGLMVTMIEDRVQPATMLIASLGSIVLAAGILAAYCMKFLLRQIPTAGKDGAALSRGRFIAFNLILFAMLVAGTLVLFNAAAAFFAVPWPMSGLHGVSPDVGKRAWGYHEPAVGFIAVNSWGQRDREHTVVPQAGSRRVIFIGDSFLENGAPVPLPYKTQDLLRAMGDASSEAINLGVSATDPDEYFFRLKKVGLPLRPDHCVLMFSAGSDFIQEPSLLSFGGISAPYPRWSFLQSMGLNSLDQVISNKRRPILRAWFAGGPLLTHELELKDIFGKTADNSETEREYLSFFPGEQQDQLKLVLSRSSATDRSSFFEMLRRPDAGMFRSYYLDMATKAAQGTGPPAELSSEYSFRWVKAAYELCRFHGVRFTLVIIPDGFSVDSRMAQQYAAIADMRAFMKHRYEAAQRLRQQATEAGMEVVDLHGLLQGQSGAYLNMDGHWSQQGVDLVAAHLVQNVVGRTTDRGTNQ